MNYFQKKKLAFMSIVNRVKGFIRTITGALPLTLEGCVDEESIIDYTLYGQSVQNGTPTPDTPVEVESVGEYDETTGKYKIPIKVSGKNLFDIDSATSVSSSNGWNKAIVNYTDQTINCNYPISYDGVTVPCNIETLEVGTYTLSVLAYIPETAPSDKCYLAAHIGDNKISKFYTLEKEVWTRINVSFTVEEQTVFHGIRFQPTTGTWNLNSPRIVAKNVQIEKSGTATDYEPYHKPITTNIYLDEPLRKVGDYADYIDFENGKVVRNVEKYTFTGKETDQGGATNDPDSFGYVVKLSSLSLSNKKAGLCNCLRQGVVASSGTNRFAYHNIANHPFVYVFFKKTDFPELGIYSPSTAKQVVKEMYDSGVPMVLYYNRNTPTETSITLPNLPTFKGTNIISADTTVQPSNAEIEYYSNVKE